MASAAWSANMLSILILSFVMSLPEEILSTSIAPRVLLLVLSGAVTKSSMFRSSVTSSFILDLASAELISKGMPSSMVSASIPMSSRRGILISFTTEFSLDSGSCLNFSYASVRFLKVNFWLSMCCQALSASSAEWGPMPIFPSRVRVSSLTRKSMARSKPRPSWDVSAVSMV